MLYVHKDNNIYIHRHRYRNLKPKNTSDMTQRIYRFLFVHMEEYMMPKIELKSWRKEGSSMILLIGNLHRKNIKYPPFESRYFRMVDGIIVFLCWESSLYTPRTKRRYHQKVSTQGLFIDDTINLYVLLLGLFVWFSPVSTILETSAQCPFLSEFVDS